MSRLRPITTASAVALLSFPLFARAEATNGLVSSYGCHNIDDVCWVQIEGFTASAFCNHDASIRWTADSRHGQRWYATIVAAHAAGKRVMLQISETTCGPNGYSTFVYGVVAD